MKGGEPKQTETKEGPPEAKVRWEVDVLDLAVDADRRSKLTSP